MINYHWSLSTINQYLKGTILLKNIELGEIQTRFAEIVWENEPISSGKLVKVCEEQLSWKKPTTYTVLRKLCEKGILQNKEGIVTSIISKGEFYQQKGRQIVNDYFKGSLPAFIASFTDRKELSAKEIDEIQELINRYKKDNDI